MESFKPGPRVKLFESFSSLNDLTLRPSLRDSITKVWPEIDRLSDIFAITPFMSKEIRHFLAGSTNQHPSSDFLRRDWRTRPSVYHSRWWRTFEETCTLGWQQTSQSPLFHSYCVLVEIPRLSCCWYHHDRWKSHPPIWQKSSSWETITYLISFYRWKQPNEMRLYKQSLYY